MSSFICIYQCRGIVLVLRVSTIYFLKQTFDIHTAYTCSKHISGSSVWWGTCIQCKQYSITWTRVCNICLVDSIAPRTTPSCRSRPPSLNGTRIKLRELKASAYDLSRLKNGEMPKLSNTASVRFTSYIRCTTDQSLVTPIWSATDQLYGTVTSARGWIDSIFNDRMTAVRSKALFYS